MSFDTSNPVINRAGAAAVKYDLSSPHQTTIMLPIGSSWSSGLHWHETHDEYLRVIQGSILVRLGNDTLILHTGEEAKVSKYVHHEWSRASASEGEDVIVVERTEPKDEEKHLFFWNLNGVILTAGGTGVLDELLITLRLFMIFSALDNWPVLFDLTFCRKYIGDSTASYLESVATHVILAVAATLGNILGYEAVERRFTPSPLLQAWNKNQPKDYQKSK